MQLHQLFIFLHIFFSLQIYIQKYIYIYRYICIYTHTLFLLNLLEVTCSYCDTSTLNTLMCISQERVHYYYHTQKNSTLMQLSNILFMSKFSSCPNNILYIFLFVLIQDPVKNHAPYLAVMPLQSFKISNYTFPSFSFNFSLHWHFG